MIKNLGNYAHPPKNGGRNINTGRHAVGSNPAPGSGVQPKNRAGQAAPAGNSPKTGASYQMTPKNPITNPTNQAAQAQSQISAPPAPFKNPAGIVGLGAPATMPYGSTFKHTAGLSGSKAPRNPPAGPVGGFKPKTLGKQVGYNFPGKKHKSPMTASAKKGGHSLLYGD